MTPIEELLRESLTSIPAPPATIDPVSRIDRRVRRAHGLLAVGSAAAVAVAAAVLVPLATSSGHSRPDTLVPADTTSAPAPSPTGPAGLEQVDVWQRSGAHGVTAGRGFLWVVSADDNDGRYLARFDRTGADVAETVLDTPADFATYGKAGIWTWGGGDGGYPDAVVQSVGLFDHRHTSLTLTGTTVLDAATYGGDVWVTVPDAVLQLRATDSGLTEVARIDLPGAQRIVATPAGHLWVQADTRLVQLIPTRDTGARIGLTEHWAGPLLGASSGDTVWTTDAADRAVELDPAALEQGQSLALSGKRLVAHGKVGWPLVVDESGGVYLLAGTDEVDYFAPGNSSGPADARLQGVEVETMAAAPGGGVALATFDTSLLHWDPTAAGR